MEDIALIKFIIGYTCCVGLFIKRNGKPASSNDILVRPLNLAIILIFALFWIPIALGWIVYKLSKIIPGTPGYITTDAPAPSIPFEYDRKIE